MKRLLSLFFISLFALQSLSLFAGAYNVSGRITNQYGSGIKNVSVNLSGPMTTTTTTDTNGDYIATVTATGNYTITPSKNYDRLNGVSSADIVIIQQHILANLPFTMGRQYIAGDANKNNSVSSADLSVIQQCILGNPLCSIIMPKSWRFVPSSYTLSVPPRGFPETISVSVAGDVSNQDFLGVKVGDENGTANPQS